MITDIPAVNQAVILAGGQATRLRPYTENIPKAMVSVAGAPIIAYQLRWLASYGVTQVVLSCGPHVDILRNYVGDGRTFNVNAVYVVEDTPRGSAGGLKFAARFLPNPSRYLALNGDIITHFPLHALTEHHHHRHGVITLGLVPYRSNWSVVDVDGSDVVRGFRQAPILPYWVNAGVCVCEPEFADLLPDRGDHGSIFQQLAENGQMFGYRINGYWRGIDTIKDVQRATIELRKQGYSLPQYSVPEKSP